jgi:hypothetical protein
MSYIYLASPYSDPDATIRALRYNAVRDAAAFFLKQRVWVYSPIVHCHDLSIEHNMPGDALFWRDYNLAMMRSATRMYVLAMDGYRESKGIAGEIEAATLMGLPWNYCTQWGNTFITEKV